MSGGPRQVLTVPASRARARSEGGFSFIEVIMALAILVMGSVSVLVLFTMGVSAQVRRRIDERERQVRPEIAVILHDAVEEARPGQSPKPIRGQALSQPGYALDVDWKMDPFDGTTPVAYAYLTYRGQRVKGVGPKPVVRSTIDPSLFGEVKKGP